MFRNKKNAEKTDEQKAARIQGLLEKEKEKRIRIKELGIVYEFPGYQAIVDKQGGKKVSKKVTKEAVIEETKKSKKSKEPE